jgi:hypothetical protein
MSHVSYIRRELKDLEDEMALLDKRIGDHYGNTWNRGDWEWERKATALQEHRQRIRDETFLWRKKIASLQCISYICTSRGNRCTADGQTGKGNGK